MSSVRVFVYGTLLTGYCNHGLVRDLVESVDQGTVSGFRLYDVGAFPGARPAERYGVRGELLTLAEPEEALRRLDALEGVPRLYTRERVTVALDSGESVQAWMYVLTPHRATRLDPLETTEGGADSWRAHKPPGRWGSGWVSENNDNDAAGDGW